MASYAMQEHRASERRACRLLGINRAGYRYERIRRDDHQIKQKLQYLAERKPRWGFGKMRDFLRNRAAPWNHKRIYRVYCEMGLNIRRKPKKRLPKREPQRLVQPSAPNICWSLDFMRDSLVGGRTLRTLNIIDDFNREVLWIEIDTSLPAERVIRTLEMITSWRGYPRRIRMDNGPELISHRMANWGEKHGVELAYIQPGKPSQNGYVERFNRTYREDVLDAYLFNSLQDVREITEQWIEEYNSIRPHAALGGVPPYEYSRIMTRLSTY